MPVLANLGPLERLTLKPNPQEVNERAKAAQGHLLACSFYWLCCQGDAWGSAEGAARPFRG